MQFETDRVLLKNVKFYWPRMTATSGYPHARPIQTMFHLACAVVIAGSLFTASKAAMAAASLASLSGQSTLHTRTGTGLAATCGLLAGAGTDRTGTSAVEDLFARCQDMVHTANALVGAGATTFSLGLTADQTNTALRGIAPDEAVAQGTNSTDFQASQSRAVAGRISALRGGAGGFSLAGLQLQAPGTKGGLLSLAELTAPKGRTGLTAGAEGSDWMAGKLGAFVSGSFGRGDEDGSNEEAGYSVDQYSLTAGADYPFTEVFTGGLAFGFAGNDSDFDNNGGDMEGRSYSITAYGSASVTDNAFIDGSLGYARNDFEMSRNIVIGAISRTANGDTDGNEISASFGGGMDFAHDGFTITPTVRLDFLDSDIDGFTETGALGLNLRVNRQSIRSVTGTGGVEVSYAISTDFGVVVPQGRVSWVHEFSDDSRAITVQYAADPNNTQFGIVTDSPDRNFFDLGLSLVVLGQVAADETCATSDEDTHDTAP